MTDFVQIQEVAEVNPTNTVQGISDDTLVTFLPMASVSESGDISFQEQRAFGDVCKGYTSFEEGDILLAKITPSMENGKATLVSSLTNRVGFGSTEFHVVRPGDRIDGRYLFYMIWNPFFRQNARGNMTGSAGQKRVPAEYLKRYEIPLPTLETQKRIADTLDKAKELIDKRKRQIEMLDDFLQSVFLDMFGDPGVNPGNWCIRPFSYFAKIDTRMVKDFREYWEMPHIGVGNIESDSGRLIGYKLVKDAGLTSGKYVFDDSHIIYSKIRPNLNKVALPEFSGLCSADAYPLLVDERHTNRYFFAHILRSNCFLDYILRHSSRTNIPKVNKRQLQSFRCICPPLRLQNEFANLVVRTEEQRKILLKSLAEMENAFNSIMQRAFKGELFN